MAKRTQPIPPDSPRGRLDRIYEAGPLDGQDQALDVLDAIAGLRSQLAEQEDYAALRARQQGATWEQIGTALGVSKQAAQQRWRAISEFAGMGKGEVRYSEREK
jgi:hypothetical protein